MSRQRERPATSSIIAIEPALLDEARAAAFLSRSVAWLRARRQEDHGRAARGEPLHGPGWIVIDKSIFYRPNDLRAWIDASAVIRGKVSFDKRLPPAPLPTASTGHAS